MTVYPCTSLPHLHHRYHYCHWVTTIEKHNFLTARKIICVHVVDQLIKWNISLCWPSCDRLVGTQRQSPCQSIRNILPHRLGARALNPPRKMWEIMASCIYANAEEKCTLYSAFSWQLANKCTSRMLRGISRGHKSRRHKCHTSVALARDKKPENDSWWLEHWSRPPKFVRSTYLYCTFYTYM